MIIKYDQNKPLHFQQDQIDIRTYDKCYNYGVEVSSY
jgi:hypothetical protein